MGRITAASRCDLPSLRAAHGELGLWQMVLVSLEMTCICCGLGFASLKFAIMTYATIAKRGLNVRRRFIRVVLLASVLALALVPKKTLAIEATSIVATVSTSDGTDPSTMLDGDYDTYVQLGAGSNLSVTASAGQPIGSLYIRWYSIPGEWTLSYVDTTGVQKTMQCGQYGFLHEYVALETPATSCVLSFPVGGAICTFDVYSQGDVPAGVQAWAPPCEKADVMVCATHADDEILWLGGVLATYAAGRQVPTQVVYMCNFWNSTPKREHEKLDGLWAIGVRNYPVNGPFDDLYSESLDAAQEQYDQDAVTSFFAEQIRRFKPQVVVSQDLNGEYGHGGHQLMAHSVQTALDHASDPTFAAQSAQAYGVWDVLKAYFHLMPENSIMLDLHQPIENLGGMTAIEAQQAAYKQHVTQQYTWFYVTDDPSDQNYDKFDCSHFGLYRSTVGPDTTNDMLEHIVTYSEQAEQQAAQEAAAKAAAEQERQAEQAQQDAQQSATDETIEMHELGLPVTLLIAIGVGVVLAIGIGALIILARH